MAKRVKKGGEEGLENFWDNFIKWTKSKLPSPSSDRKGEKTPPLPPAPSSTSLPKNKGIEEVAKRWFTPEEHKKFEKLINLLKKVEEEWGIAILGLFLELWRGRELLIESKIDKLQIAQLLHRESRRFFRGIWEFRSPYRRGILAEIGKLLSEGFEGIRFLSPEEWEKIDPNYHLSVKGKGEGIKRGLSFIVIGENGGTLYYGEIESYPMM